MSGTLALEPYEGLKYDWGKPEHRLYYENKIKTWRRYRATWTVGEGIMWFIRLVLFQFSQVLLLYGSMAYVIVS